MDVIIELSGNHETTLDARYAAMGDALTYDVLVDCWVYKALTLNKFDPNATQEGWVPVPFGLLVLALGGGLANYGDEPLKWDAIRSAPSAVALNHFATNANAKGFGLNDGGDVIVYESAWHMRQQIVAFSCEHVDYEGNDNFALVVEAEDRIEANTQDLTSQHLLVLNGLKLKHLVSKQHLHSWSLLGWVLGFPTKDIVEDDDGEFCVVARTLIAAAKLDSPQLAESSVHVALAAFLTKGERLPADLLTDHSEMADKLDWIRLVSEYSKSENRGAMLEANFSIVLKRHPQLARWIGSGPSAYSNFCDYSQLLMPGIVGSFELLPRLTSRLSKYDAYWKDEPAAVNLHLLTSLLETSKSSGGVPGMASSGSTGETDFTRTRHSAAYMTTLLVQMNGWKKAQDSDEPPDAFELIEMIMASGFTPAIKWILGIAKTHSLPSDFSTSEFVTSSLRFDDYLVDTITTGSDGEVDHSLSDLTVADFDKSFLKKLKEEKISEIDWDKDFVCVLLKMMNGGRAVKSMSTKDVLRDAERLAHHQGTHIVSTESPGSPHSGERLAVCYSRMRHLLAPRRQTRLLTLQPAPSPFSQRQTRLLTLQPAPLRSKKADPTADSAAGTFCSPGADPTVLSAAGTS